MKSPMPLIFLLLGLLLASNAMAAGRVFVPLQDTGAGTYSLSGSIGHMEPVQWLLDTGSGYPVIDYAALSRLIGSGSAHYLRNITAVMADARRRLIPIYQVERLTLGQNCTLQDVEVAVIPDVRRNIMGMRVLKQLAPFEITLDPPGIQLSHCDE